MLLPLFSLVFTILYAITLHQAVVEHLIIEIMTEKEPVFEIQALIQKAMVPVNLYVLNEYPEGKKEFNQISQQIDSLIDASLLVAYDQDYELEMLESVKNKWTILKQNAENIFQISLSPDNRLLTELAIEINKKLIALQDDFDSFQESSNEELLEEAEFVKQAEQKIYFYVMTAFILGLLLSVTSGLYLAKSILNPLEIVKDGAKQLAVGNLQHRLPVDRLDELGSVMKTFNQMAGTLENNEIALKHLATREPLTGLLNHREYFRLLQEELNRSKRYNHSLSVLMMDLDDFKSVNDEKGHLAGDHVLRTVSDIIKSQVRKSDYASRYGGDEFSILLPETEQAKSLEFAERLLGKITQKEILLENGENITVRISIGLSTYPEAGDTLLDLVSSADKALYTAKNKGKNKVCCYNS